MAICGDCYISVLWVPIGDTRQKVCVEEHPTPRGNVRIEHGKAEILGAVQAKLAANEGETLYLQHTQCRKARRPR